MRTLRSFARLLGSTEGKPCVVLLIFLVGVVLELLKDSMIGHELITASIAYLFASHGSGRPRR
jgi:hypothetical protein